METQARVLRIVTSMTGSIVTIAAPASYIKKNMLGRFGVTSGRYLADARARIHPRSGSVGIRAGRRRQARGHT